MSDGLQVHVSSPSRAPRGPHGGCLSYPWTVSSVSTPVHTPAGAHESNAGHGMSHDDAGKYLGQMGMKQCPLTSCKAIMMVRFMA